MNKKETEEHIKHLETAGNNLLQQATNLRNGFKLSSKCKHGEYTNKFWGNKDCKPCGSPKTVMCDIKADGRKSHDSRKCNANGCKCFEV